MSELNAETVISEELKKSLLNLFHVHEMLAEPSAWQEDAGFAFSYFTRSLPSPGQEQTLPLATFVLALPHDPLTLIDLFTYIAIIDSVCNDSLIMTQVIQHIYTL